MQNSPKGIPITELSLPKSGGTITGMGETPGGIAPNGAASFTLPLPISAGRGYAPTLSLNYSSNAGNGPFGLGWQADLMSIRRRTCRGVPGYSSDDEFIGPSGEVLVMVSQSHS